MEEKIIEIIRKITAVEEIKTDENLIYSLGFNSKKVMQLLIKLESAFKISIKEEDLDIENFSSIDAITKLVRKYQDIK